jgi:cytidyltransferase-like protein
MKSTVLVSGCFDHFHSGHVEFLQQASQYGRLVVSIGSDKTIKELKNKETLMTEQERLFMVKAITCVDDAFISRGSGLLDFIKEAENLRPNILVVNDDGDTEDKQLFCKEHNIRYVVLQRVPHADLPPRSTTALRKELSEIPFRLDLAGGWLDQPYVSKHFPGPVINVALAPTENFDTRSGMATSTRERAIDMWGFKIPPGHREKFAKMLFAYENPPGTHPYSICGSQDAIGVLFDGIKKIYYDNDYWPTNIESCTDQDTLDWLSSLIHLMKLPCRDKDFHPAINFNPNKIDARRLSIAAEGCWKAILSQDKTLLGLSMKDSYNAAIAMFPSMETLEVQEAIERWGNNILGYKIAGAGGGGYFVLCTETPPEGSIQLRFI